MDDVKLLEQQVSSLEKSVSSLVFFTYWFVGIQVSLFTGVFLLALPWAWNLQKNVSDTTIKLAVVDEKVVSVDQKITKISTDPPSWLIEKVSKNENNIEQIKKDLFQLQKVQ